MLKQLLKECSSTSNRNDTLTLIQIYWVVVNKKIPPPIEIKKFRANFI